MEYEIKTTKRTLHFKQPAGTSRGIYTTRQSWFIEMKRADMPDKVGIGECAPLPNLSCDDIPEYEAVLEEQCRIVVETGRIDLSHLQHYPSMLFGLETAFRDLVTDHHALFDTPFASGDEGIPINGLVWMGSKEEMSRRIEDKLSDGFTCVKLKIGAIDFSEEIGLLKGIRERFGKDYVELRVDANGAFLPSDAMRKLDALAALDIHSIEQPIKNGQWEEMSSLCRESPVAIALDEELIGIVGEERKKEMLDKICPDYIILKPSLHGGMAGCEEWVRLARERNIGSWMTSALESNVGLNAVAHLAAHLYGPDIRMPQGLGTGQLFTDNIDMPVRLQGSWMWFDKCC